MNFRSLTQILSRTRSAPLRYEECSSIGKKKILIVDDNSDLRKRESQIQQNKLGFSLMAVTIASSPVVASEIV